MFTIKIYESESEKRITKNNNYEKRLLVVNGIIYKIHQPRPMGIHTTDWNHRFLPKSQYFPRSYQKHQCQPAYLRSHSTLIPKSCTYTNDNFDNTKNPIITFRRWRCFIATAETPDEPSYDPWHLRKRPKNLKGTFQPGYTRSWWKKRCPSIKHQHATHKTGCIKSGWDQWFPLPRYKQTQPLSILLVSNTS